MALELRMPSVRALGTSVEVDIGEVDRGVFEQAWTRCLSSEADASDAGPVAVEPGKSTVQVNVSGSVQAR